MSFTKSQKEDTFKILAAILNLGNITFTQAGGAQVAHTIMNCLVQSCAFFRCISPNPVKYSFCSIHTGDKPGSVVQFRRLARYG
jgi:hypothetical protein